MFDMRQDNRSSSWPAGSTGYWGALMTAAIAVAFAAVRAECRHWFLISVTLCGAIVARDALDWLTGRLDQFDPVGIVGLFGWHFFFLAPILHVTWDYWLPYVSAPPDWRDELGEMAALNAAGLALYVACRNVIAGSQERVADRVRLISPRRFARVVAIILAVSALLQIWVYVRMGGVRGYIEAATDMNDRQRMRGMGPLFMVSESFPIIAAMSFVAFARGRAVRSWLVLVPMLALSFGLLLFFGGLRGSRSNTV